MTRKNIRSFACWWLILVSSLPTLAQQLIQQAGSTPFQPRSRGLSLRTGPPLGVNDRVGALHIHGFSAYGALQEISRKANVVIGVEMIVYKSDKGIQFDFPGGTVADLLNAFVSKAPDFRWQDDGGIIHVFRGGQHPALADLEVDYPGASEKSRYEIWMSLHQRPEYMGWMKSSQCHPVERLRSDYFKFDIGPIDIPAGRLTIAQVLDQAAMKSGDGFWAVLQSDPSDSVGKSRMIEWSLPD